MSEYDRSELRCRAFLIGVCVAGLTLLAMLISQGG